MKSADETVDDEVSRSPVRPVYVTYGDPFPRCLECVGDLAGGHRQAASKPRSDRCWQHHTSRLLVNCREYRLFVALAPARTTAPE
jgi:hypothetical protein